MVLLYCGHKGTYLLLVVTLSTYLKTCDGIQRKDYPKIPIDENLTRPEVRTPQGTVRGINMVTHHRRNIFGFKRIPYAQPPVGNLRFKGPLPAGGWNGTLDAGGDCNLCPRLVGKTPIGDEDCLYLNVYTPRLPASENSTLLPVMFYVYGGAFKEGHNNPKRWGPNFLLDQDVVFVVPAYRLNVLGFFSTGDEVAPGNYGLKDMVQALKWNQDNIQFFGGDPNRVTLAGGSSGAMSVHLLTLSKSTNGLFHRYISQSGSALLPGVQQPRNVLVNRATKLGEYFGCPTNTSTVLVNCLRGLNTSQLIVGANSIFEVFQGYPKAPWGPTVESNTEGAFITDIAENFNAPGTNRDLPWLCSVNRDEGIGVAAQFYGRPDKFEEFLDKIDFFLPYFSSYEGFVENVTAYTTALKSYYMNDLTANRNLLLANFTKLVGDALFNYPTYRGIQQYLHHGQGLLYLASFEYRGVLASSYKFSGGSTEDHGVSHADETIYLFEDAELLSGPPGSKMSEADWKMVDTMVQLWTSFVINGTPVVDPKTIRFGNHTIWEPYSLHKKYIRIGSNSDLSIGVKQKFFEDRSSFWEALRAATSWKLL